MTIRRRLMLWYTVALVLALGAIAGTLYYEIFIEHPAIDVQWRLKAVGETPEEELGEALLFAGIPVAILSLAVAWLIIRRAFVPVTRLKSAAERLQAENLPARLQRSGNNDELDQLTDVFNAMTDRLHRSFQRVREFTLHASHELKTPLAIMQGEMETALRQEAISPDERRRLTSLLEEVQRLTHIVDGLNFLSRADAGLLHLENAAVPLDELVQEACADARVLAEAQGIHVETGRLDAVRVRGDRRRLRQLLLILTDNAIKYNRHDGTVAMHLAADKQRATVTITNTGPGIPAEQLERVFDRFYRGDPSHNKAIDGAGLGLSIARGIVQAHDGEIDVDSVPGGLTTVRTSFRALPAVVREEDAIHAMAAG